LVPPLINAVSDSRDPGAGGRDEKGSVGEFFENIRAEDAAAQKSTDDDQTEAEPTGVDGESAQPVADENT